MDNGWSNSIHFDDGKKKKSLITISITLVMNSASLKEYEIGKEDSLGSD